jgi:hypothetical protein
LNPYWAAPKAAKLLVSIESAQGFLWSVLTAGNTLSLSRLSLVLRLSLTRLPAARAAHTHKAQALHHITFTLRAALARPPGCRTARTPHGPDAARPLIAHAERAALCLTFNTRGRRPYTGKQTPFAARRWCLVLGAWCLVHCGHVVHLLADCGEGESFRAL